MDKRTDYALRASAYLALHHDEERDVSTAEISDGSGAPRKYLAHILLALKKKALITSTPGRGGGYRLMRRPELISVKEIMDAVSDAAPGSGAGYAGRAGGDVFQIVSDMVDLTAKTAVKDAVSRMSLAKVVSEAVMKKQRRQ